MGASWVLPSATLSTGRSIHIKYLDIILLLGLILNTMQVTIYTKNVFLILSLYLPNLRKSANYQISALNGLVCRDFSVVPDSVFVFSENSQIFFGRFLNFSKNFNLFFLLLFCFSLFSIKITHFIFFRKKITAFEINSKIFDNRIIIDRVFLG